MKKKAKLKTKDSRDFDERFDAGEETIDFSSGVKTEGLSKTIKLPPMDVPAWLAAEIERLAALQANSKTSVVRQLLVEAIEARKRRAS
ncbi:MAG: hypothetical protein IT573_00600 [Deltaproteobacteria bacterium]|nr:hypothetical protein [Deltaproteobacteria bacterium]